MSFLLDSLKEAKKLYTNNEFDKALQCLQALILENNKDYRIYHLLALIYHKNGNFNKAINNYNKAIQLNPNDIESHINISLVYNDLGKYEVGVNFYKKAFDIFNTMQLRKFNNSQSDIEDMFSKQHNSIGELYLRYDRLDEAMTQFQKAVDLNQSNLSATLNLAELLFRIKRKKEAFKILRFLKKDHNDFYQARVKLGHFYYLEGKFGEAIEEWDEVLIEDAQNVDARMFKKMIYENTILT